MVFLLCLVGLLLPACPPAQSATPAHHPLRHRRATAKKAATDPVQPTTPPAPVAPPQPKWPANTPPAAPSVTFNNQGLHIVAENATLSSILNQVSTETGAKVEGLSGDERVFGDYGPGLPREVLADLLSGVNYNVLIVGDEAEGLPLHVLLSPRRAGMPNGQPNARPQPQDQDEDFQAPEPQEAPQFFQPQRPPNEPFNGRPVTPEERMQQMQERQRELEQQQQQQQPQ